MDYDRNSFAKNIESLVTLYDVRSAYNKHKEILHSDSGLKEKFQKRLNALLHGVVDEKSGDTVLQSHCPLMIAALEEILEYLEETDFILPVRSKIMENEPVEEAVEVAPVKKKRPSIFREDSNNLEEFFHKKSETENILEDLTLEVIKKALEMYDFNLTKASKHLGISHRTLRTKIQDIKDKEKDELRS